MHEERKSLIFSQVHLSIALIRNIAPIQNLSLLSFMCVALLTQNKISYSVKLLSVLWTTDSDNCS